MHHFGLPPPDTIQPYRNKVERFPTNGKKHDTAGWYVYHDDHVPWGAFGCHRQGVNQSWRATVNIPISQTDIQLRNKLKKEVETLLKEDARKHHQKTFNENQAYWESLPDAVNHPYLDRKGVASFGLKVDGTAIVIPLNANEKIVGFQSIYEDGQKRFFKGSQTKNSYYLIGQANTSDSICICEGYATAASVHMATGYPVVVSFSASNLLGVCRIVRNTYPSKRVIICADDDWKNQPNIGIEKATEAAKATKALLAIPKFKDDRGGKMTDFNDAHLTYGLGQVKTAVESAAPVSDTNSFDEWLKPLPLPPMPPVEGIDYEPLPIESHGDIRNAKAFASLASGELIYVTTRGRWLKWDKTRRWILCEKEEEVAFAKMCCARILGAASSIFGQDHERGKKMISQAITAHNLPRIQAMLRLAISEPDMAVTDRELDMNPYQLGVLNGVVNLKTGEHIDNQPHYYITRYCNANFEDDAVCPNWIRFLYQIFEEDEATIESVQRLLGYTLTGLVTEEIAVICYGVGSNGKSVFGNVINQILGGYSTTAASTVLTTRRSDDASPRNDLAALAGARYVSINELQAGDRLDEQVVKMIAGREPISARFLHKEFFEYMPTFTAWLRTNHKPIVTGEDDGIWRRLVLLRFNRKFSDGEKDPNLEEKLLAESQGILQWMLEGARKYFADGLRLSPRILHEHAKYRTESDLLGEFIADVMQADANAKINQNTAYEAWTNWCKLNGFRLSTKKSFTQRLAERGFPDGKSGSNRFYVGLKLQVDNTYS